MFGSQITSFTRLSANQFPRYFSFRPVVRDFASPPAKYRTSISIDSRKDYLAQLRNNRWCIDMALSIFSIQNKGF